jgi:hypothetical protein
MTRTTLVACLTLLLLAAPPALAAGKVAEPGKPAKPTKPVKPAPTERVGLIKKVEPNQLTLKTYGKLSAELVIPVDAKTQVQVNGEPATIADVKAGMEAVISPLNGTAQKVLAQKEGKKKKDKDKKKDKPTSSPTPPPEK